MLVIIDHYDSFTYTIKNYFEYLNIKTIIIQYDDPHLDQIHQLQPTHIVLSPGPGCPQQATHTIKFIQQYYTKYPILGICLGHQCLLHAFGGKIVQAREIMHGKISKISHNNQGIFNNIPQKFTATRYHSLIIDNNTMPQDFIITAWTNDIHNHKIIMAVQHKQYPIF